MGGLERAVALRASSRKERLCWENRSDSGKNWMTNRQELDATSLLTCMYYSLARTHRTLFKNSSSSPFSYTRNLLRLRLREHSQYPGSNTDVGLRSSLVPLSIIDRPITEQTKSRCRACSRISFIRKRLSLEKDSRDTFQALIFSSRFATARLI